MHTDNPRPISHNTSKPDFVYVARNHPCGCVTGLVNDGCDKFTAESVAEFIADGQLRLF